MRRKSPRRSGGGHPFSMVVFRVPVALAEAPCTARARAIKLATAARTARAKAAQADRTTRSRVGQSKHKAVTRQAHTSPMRLPYQCQTQYTQPRHYPSPVPLPHLPPSRLFLSLYQDLGLRLELGPLMLHQGWRRRSNLRVLQEAPAEQWKKTGPTTLHTPLLPTTPTHRPMTRLTERHAALFR